jgi:hypothetical protein
MIFPLKSLLNVSGITKRNDGLPLIREGKVSGNKHVPRLVSPVNRTLQPFDIRKSFQKLICRLWQYGFFSVSVSLR